MITISRDDRFRAILDLIPEAARTALDVGCADSFRDVYVKSGRRFDRVLGINVYDPFIRELAGELRESHPHYEFVCADVREYPLRERFDVVTLQGVAEHFTLEDLADLLDRMVRHCDRIIVDTPEQYEPNEWAVKAMGNPFERHLSLVTADFLARWAFEPVARYWVNEQFSDCIYLRNEVHDTRGL